MIFLINSESFTWRGEEPQKGGHWHGLTYSDLPLNTNWCQLCQSTATVSPRTTSEQGPLWLYIVDSKLSSSSDCILFRSAAISLGRNEWFDHPVTAEFEIWKGLNQWIQMVFPSSWWWSLKKKLGHWGQVSDIMQEIFVSKGQALLYAFLLLCSSNLLWV